MLSSVLSPLFWWPNPNAPTRSYPNCPLNGLSKETGEHPDEVDTSTQETKQEMALLIGVLTLYVKGCPCGCCDRVGEVGMGPLSLSVMIR